MIGSGMARIAKTKADLMAYGRRSLLRKPCFARAAKKYLALLYIHRSAIILIGDCGASSNIYLGVPNSQNPCKEHCNNENKGMG